MNSEDLLRIARGDDPLHPPIWNGPPTITTPPALPLRPMVDEGQLFEFLFSYPIHIFDSADWPVLKIVRDGVELHLLKPLSQSVKAKEKVAAGNEGPDLYCSNIRVILLGTTTGFPITHQKAFMLVKDTLQWIRILTRQYWIGSGVVGVSARYRGSAFKVQGAAVSQMNYASYGSAVLVRALSRKCWESLIPHLERDVPVPVSESIFCDGLSSLASGDNVRCLVELGVAADIEVTNLLDDLAALKPRSKATSDYLKKRDRLDFSRKLRQLSVLFGCSDPKHFSVPGKPADWAEKVALLYRFRNKAVHEGLCVISDGKGGLRPLAEGELQAFIFAMEALYRWSTEERMKLAVLRCALSVERTDQIIGIIGETVKEGGFVLDTGEAFNPNALSPEAVK